MYTQTMSIAERQEDAHDEDPRVALVKMAAGAIALARYPMVEIVRTCALQTSPRPSSAASASDAADALNALDMSNVPNALDMSDMSSAANTANASDASNVLNAGLDVSNVLDVVSASDVVNVPYTSNVSDTSNTPDTSNVSDTSNAPDVSNASDASNVSDASSAPRSSGAPELMRSPFNAIYASARCWTHEDRDVVTPANDFLYLSGWVDLADGPVLLDIPAIDGKRYFVIELLDAFTNNFVNLSARSIGTRGGRFALYMAGAATHDEERPAVTPTTFAASTALTTPATFATSAVPTLPAVPATSTTPTALTTPTTFAASTALTTPATFATSAVPTPSAVPATSTTPTALTTPTTFAASTALTAPATFATSAVPPPSAVPATSAALTAPAIFATSAVPATSTIPTTLTVPTTPVACPTRLVWLVGRVLVHGDDDLPAAREVANAFRLHGPGDTNGAPCAGPASVRRWRAGGDAALDFFQNVFNTLADFPVREDEAPMFELLARAGVTCNETLEVAALPQAIQQGLRQGYAGTRRLIVSFAQSRARRGWTYNLKLGRYGHDHLLRACAAMKGLGALAAEEAVYAWADFDETGAHLDGRQRYELYFPPGHLPPVDALWSLSLYGAERFFVDNPIRRYAIGDRTPGLHYDAHGGLRIPIQHDAPNEPARVANWLPAPAGNFYLILRLYHPQAAFLEGRYTIPAVRPVPSLSAGECG